MGDREEFDLYVNIALYGNIVSLVHGCLYTKPSSIWISVQRIRDDPAFIVDIIF
jgi:hypothetical protein